MEKKMIYMDHAATTPLCETAREAMRPFLEEQFGNPGGIYTLGVEAKKALNQSRRTIAACIGAQANEIVFTSGGTEADNYAIKGYYFAKYLANPSQKYHIITTAFEHHAVLHTCQFLEKLGAEVTYLKPNKEGFVTTEQLESAMKNNTILVSIMMANNEIGTIQPIKKLAQIVHAKGAIFHTDGVQTVGHLPIAVGEMGVDMLSASGHKFGGPKGVGFLYVRGGIQLESFQHGGGQERSKRAGTENVCGIVGMTAALQEKCNNKQLMIAANRNLEALRDYFWEKISHNIEGISLNGTLENRLPGNLNISIQNVDSEAALLHLNKTGICAAGGSACTSSSDAASHVLLAIGLEEYAAKSSIRFTLGEANTKEEVDLVVQNLKEVVAHLRTLMGV